MGWQSWTQLSNFHFRVKTIKDSTVSRLEFEENSALKNKDKPQTYLNEILL